MKQALATKGNTIFVLAVLLLALALSFSAAEAFTPYHQTNLVSNIPGLAAHTDSTLKNPWGISHSSSSPFWVSVNGSGFSNLYNGAGVKQGLVVTIPPVGAGNPTGQVFNQTNSIGTFNGNLFLFVSEDGTISGWRGALGTTAETLQLALPGNVYKGAAFATTSGHSYLYATNFRAGTIDVLKGDAGAPNLPGMFTDPGIPSGFAPFNIQNLGDQLYVTYAKQDAFKHDDVAGPGNGFLDKFDLNGNLITRLVTNGALNSPWGLALAPTDFGEFSNALLVGNFGDGLINAFDPATGNPLGTLRDVTGQPIFNDGLWGLIFGNDGNAGKSNTLFFTAGLNAEADGLFGSMAPAPVPSALLLFGSGILALAAGRKKFLKMRRN